MEYLKLCGEIAGLSKTQIKSRSEELLELVGLKDQKKRISGFSRGMKQRLGIAQALLNEPKLLICDEPTSALDPIGRKEILDFCLRQKGRRPSYFRPIFYRMLKGYATVLRYCMTESLRFAVHFRK